MSGYLWARRPEDPHLTGHDQAIPTPHDDARGAIRFAANLLAQPDARHRVFAMRRTFRRYRRQVTAVTIIAGKPDGCGPVSERSNGS